MQRRERRYLYFYSFIPALKGWAMDKSLNFCDADGNTLQGWATDKSLNFCDADGNTLQGWAMDKSLEF